MELVLELEHRLNDRNYLVHRFFWPHAQDIVGKVRREFLIQELDKMAERFLLTNRRLTRIYYEWLAAEGMPRDVLARHLFRRNPAWGPERCETGAPFLLRWVPSSRCGSQRVALDRSLAGVRTHCDLNFCTR
jgi:hypothetical protein